MIGVVRYRPTQSAAPATGHLFASQRFSFPTDAMPIRNWMLRPEGIGQNAVGERRHACGHRPTLRNADERFIQKPEAHQDY